MEAKFVEPMLQPTNDRFVLFPIVHKDIWRLYKKQLASFWVTNSVDLANDVKQWNLLNKNEQHFIKHVLAFFAASDGIVLENIAERFMTEVQYPEARCFYGLQIAMENIHSEMYSLMLDTYIRDSHEKLQLFHAMETIPCVKAKAEWALKWIESNASFAERLIAFCAVEGIFFSGSFCAIFWLKKRNLMHGLTLSNEYISRDEGLHVEFACLLYSKLSYPCSPHRVQEIITSAVQIEKSFICDALPCSLLGMNQELMSQYIEYVADWHLCVLGCPKFYNATNPFPWMQMISLKQKTNFFEDHESAYQLPGVMDSLVERTQTDGFRLDEDF